MTALAPRVWRHQVVRAIVDHKLAVVLGAVLDGEHPGVGVVDQLVPPRIFRNFVQPRVALLLNRVRSVADGTNPIQQQGDAGLDKITKYAWGNKLVHNSHTWMFAIEHSAEHYGQLVVYYRANNLVPPDPRR